MVGRSWHDNDVATDSGVPTLVLARGDEPLLVSRAIQRVTARARRADPETDVRTATGTELTPGGFADLVAPSLFAEPRVVVVRSAQDVVKDVAQAIRDYAGAPVDGVSLVVHHSGGARNKPLADALVKSGAAVVSCAKITKTADRINFVRHEIKAAGGTAAPDAVAALVEAVGADLAELAAAAGQLVSDTGGMVDEAAVRRYHRGRAEVSGFTVADLIVGGNPAAALEALRWALAIGVPQVVIADAIADGIRTVAKVAGAAGANTYQLASEWGMPPWKIDKARGPARHWSATGLTEAMVAVARLNADVKGQATDADYALERAVIDLGRARARR